MNNNEGPNNELERCKRLLLYYVGVYLQVLKYMSFSCTRYYSFAVGLPLWNNHVVEASHPLANESSVGLGPR